MSENNHMNENNNNIEDKKTKQNKFSELTGIHKAVPIALAGLAAFVIICLFTSGSGVLGPAVGGALKGLFSIGAYAIPLLLLWQAYCYPDDLANNKILKRVLFSLELIITISCIDYAIYSFDGAVFSPALNYTQMVGGGFVGGVIGFAIAKLIGSIGTIILALCVNAVITVFFFADKAGSLGQAAKSFSESAKKINDSIKEKKQENDTRKKQQAEEEAQLQREATSEALINDDFFTAKGPSSNVKVRQLGIDEEYAPHGTSPLIHPSKRPVFEEPEQTVSEPIERRRKRADKPLDLSYGMTEEELNPTATKEEEVEAAEEVPAVVEEEPKKNEYTKAFFGLDDSADNVFTKDFDPFDFATSEKASAQFAKKVSISTVQEELDEFALYEKKMNHIPTAREKRMAELEERKKAWDSSRGHTAPVREEKIDTAPVEEPKKSEPVSIPLSVPATENVTQSSERTYEPAKEIKPEPEKINTYSGYSNTKTTYNQPIKTVEFTISKGPKTEQEKPVEGESVSMKINKPIYQEETENIAILISDRIARETPGYLRSANDLKTFTKVTSSPEEDELLLRLQGAFNTEGEQSTHHDEDANVNENHGADTQVSEIHAETPGIHQVDKNSVEFIFGAPEIPAIEEVQEATAVEAEVDEQINEAIVEGPVSEAATEAVAVEETAEEPITNEEPAPTAPSPVHENRNQAAYQRAAGFASALVNQAQPTVTFKPYVPASVSASSNHNVEENTLKTEREMLTPTPTQKIATPAINFAPAPTQVPAPTTVAPTPAPTQVAASEATFTAEPAIQTIPQSVPMALPTSEPTLSSTPAMNIPLAVPTQQVETKAQEVKEPENNDIGIPLFSVIDDDGSEKSDEGVSIDGADFRWTNDDVNFSLVEPSAPSIEEDALDFSKNDEDDVLPTNEIPEEETEEIKEIPPEEQNPDVIKMREMFPFLFSNDSSAASTPSENTTQQKSEYTPSAPKAENIVPEEEIDDVPFDDPKIVKEAAFEPITKKSATASSSTSLVVATEKKSERKKPDYSDYKFPSLELLAKEESSSDENIQAEIQENADKLIETLASFNVTASIKGVDRGPRITRYEVVPAKGVKVSQIMNLQDDIALNLAAGAIRMEAPIPGKSAVGIEIPNKKSSIVRLRDLLETADFQSSRSKTFVCIGRDVAGQPVFGDIAKMPHLLIAGATGMGKSVCINSLLISVLYKARPDEVKFIMIDPKQVEFTMYNGIPHLLVPVVSDPKQAAGALMWAVEEMERRYNLLNPLCVRNIEAYNEKVTADPSLGDPMPRIVIVIDEFADLMLQVKDPVETLVMRIAQKARAAGIYLVIGTQRPSVNVITGVIKANVPSRISCKVMSNVDSKTVLDSAGAEKLLDRGDALYAPAGSPKPHRVQCAFVADGEVESIMNYLKQYSDGSNYDSTVMEEIERAAQKCSKKGGGNNSDYDDGDGDSDSNGEGYLNNRQFLDAVEVAVNTRKISTSLIQRKLSIGYGKAAKFIDIMEDMGIVGEANGQRPREVLLTPDEWREKLARASLD